MPNEKLQMVVEIGDSRIGNWDFEIDWEFVF
jgi:hypothetical protein